MGFSQDMHTISVQLLGQYGDSGIIRQITYGDYDPKTSKRAESITELAVFYVQENATNNNTASLSSGTPGITGSSDLRITTATPDYSKIDRTYEIVLYNGDIAEILDASPVSTQNGVVIYELQARIKV